jgi:hypothetical protein
MVRSGHYSICDPSLFSKADNDHYNGNDHHCEWLDSISRFKTAIISDGVVVESGNGYLPVKVCRDRDGLITPIGVSF